MLMRVEWARHGQNVANLTETFSHRIFDGDLTELGRQQAHQLGERLAARGATYSLMATSPLRRAVQTAEIVAGHIEVGVDLVLDDLREVNVGELDGRNDPDSWAIYAQTLQSWLGNRLTERFPSGEDGHELVDRIRRALASVAQRAADGPALVVAHGANIRAVLPSLTGAADPGCDLRTGDLARFEVTEVAGSELAVRLVGWGTSP